MKNLARFAVLSLLTATFTATASDAAASVTLLGSDSLETMVKRVLATCSSNVSGATFFAGSSDAAVSSMINGSQQIAPIGRLLTIADACGPNQSKAEQLEIAADAVNVVTSPSSALQCKGQVSGNGVAWSKTITVKNGIGPDTSYTFSAWKDVLRVLFAGRDQAHLYTAPGGRPADCNSNIRKALWSNWANLFQAGCDSGACTKISHVWRPSDLPGAVDTFIALLGLPGAPLPTPFCNGTDGQDLDPIRVPCDPADAVCGSDGTLGLLQPITVPESAPIATAYPMKACDIGVYGPLLRASPLTPAPVAG